MSTTLELGDKYSTEKMNNLKLKVLAVGIKASIHNFWGFCDGSVGKESSCHARDWGDMGSIPESEDSLDEEMATHSSILAWKIPWT